jgi:MFS family permease
MVDGDREDPPENDGPLASTSSRRSAGNVYKQLLADLEEREMGGGLNLNEHIEAVGWGKFQRTALVAFVLFVVSEAMEVTVPNVLWQKVSDSPAFSPGLDGHTTTFRAIVTGAPMLGNVFGGILGGVIADAHGRHPAIYLHCALFVLSSLVSALSQTRTSFLLSRMALGASLGIIVPVIVSYMAELAPSKYRARAVVIIPGFGFPLGQVLMLMCGLLLHHYSDDADTRSAAETTDSDSFGWWRVMLVAGIIPNVAAMLLVRFCVPESPHFLVGSGRQKEAEEVLREIARVNRTEHRLQCHGRILRAPGKRSDAHADSDEVSVDGGPGTHTGDKDNSWAGRVERLKKQGIELLSPPLHVYVVMILGMWMFAVIGQTGAGLSLPLLLSPPKCSTPISPHAPSHPSSVSACATHRAATRCARALASLFAMPTRPPDPEQT